MTYYRTMTKITPDGKIILPDEWRGLFAHKVELTLKDLEQPKVAVQNPVALLDNLIQLYNNEEAEIDISEIYLNRSKEDDREIK